MMEWYLIDHYNHYTNERNGKLSKKIYKKIINEFNQQLIDKLLTGIPINLGGNLATIQVKRANRNFSKPKINWGATNKLKKKLIAEGKKLYDKETGEGEEYLVYHTDNYYCYLHWHRVACSVPNKTVYRFYPSRGKRGLATRLKQFLHADEINKLNFEFSG